MRKLAIAGFVILTAIMVASLASAGSVGIGIKKSSDFTGTGSSGAPLDLSNAVTVPGTLSLASMTAGSILFAGASGLVSQDNAQLFFEDSGNRLGVGTATPGVFAGPDTGPQADTIAHFSRTGVASHSFVLNAGGTAKDAGLSLFTDTVGEDASIWVDHSGSRTLKISMGLVENEAARDAAVKVTVDQAGYASLLYGMAVGRGVNANGAAIISGTTYASHFSLGTPEDTYIRGGKAASIVYIGDSNTGGIEVGATGNATNVNGALTVDGDSVLGNAQADTASIWGHVMYYGTAPTLSGCTGTCTIASYSTDARGRITCTDDSGANCTVTFATTYDTNAPACSLTYEDATAPAAIPYVYSTSTSAFVFDQVGGAQAHAYTYACDGMK